MFDANPLRPIYLPCTLSPQGCSPHCLVGRSLDGFLYQCANQHYLIVAELSENEGNRLIQSGIYQPVSPSQIVP